MKIYLIGRQINLTGMKTNLTVMQINLTGMKTYLIGRQTNLTGRQINLTGRQVNPTGLTGLIENQAEKGGKTAALVSYPVQPGVEATKQPAGASTWLFLWFICRVYYLPTQARFYCLFSVFLLTGGGGGGHRY
jgi:hypothetical protein